MKVVIVGVASFVLALAVGTGVRVMTAPAPKDAARADSTATAPQAPAGDAQPVAATSMVEPVPAPPSSAAARPETAAATAPGAVPHASGAPSPRAVTAPAAHGAPDAPAAKDSTEPAPEADERPQESYKSLAKILASMKPAEAGKIMAHFTDEQIEGLLRASSVRQAAVFLAQLPTERAAALGRRLMIEPAQATP
jgi:hypothetical protein